MDMKTYWQINFTGFERPRFSEWGTFGIGFWTGTRGLPTRKVAALSFPVGPQGPVEGCLGDPLREFHAEAARRWVDESNLPGKDARFHAHSRLEIFESKKEDES